MRRYMCVRTYLLEWLQSKHHREFKESQGDGHLGIRVGFCRQVVAAFGQMDILLHAQALLVHVAQVEHCLSVVLLFRGQAIVRSCSFIIHSSAQPIIVIVAQFYLVKQLVHLFDCIFVNKQYCIFTCAAEYPCAAALPQYSSALEKLSLMLNMRTSDESSRNAALLWATS